ncbi:hypothetical protein JCM18899A_08020 [Nocardioides sp. AN3]
MSWLKGKSAAKPRADEMAAWCEALGSDVGSAEQEGLVRYGHFERIGGQTIDGVFLTGRHIYLRSYSPISQRYYGPLTIVPLDLVVVAGPLDSAGSSRWGLAVAVPGADVEKGVQPLTGYAFEGLTTKAAVSRPQDVVAELRKLLAEGRVRVLSDATPAAGSARSVEAALLLSATADDPRLRSDLERSWLVLDARSRGLPVPDRAA